MLSMIQTVTVRQECILCKQDMNGMDESDMEMAFNGVEAYGICPHCRRSIEKGKVTEKWRGKVDKYIKKSEGKEG